MYPEQELNFCTFATYEHTKLALNISPSASIDLNGISPSIGISLSSTSDIFTLELSDVISYRP